MKNPSNYIFSLGEDFYDFLLEKKEIISKKSSVNKASKKNDIKIEEKDLDADSTDVITA